jgi:hypothetical protein
MSTSTQLPASFNPLAAHPFTSFASPRPDHLRANAQESLFVTNPGFAAALGFESPTTTPLSSPSSTASQPGSPAMGHAKAPAKKSAAAVRQPVFELFTPDGRSSPEPRIRKPTQTWGLPATPKRK